MLLIKNDICAFDECSILHLCEIVVPKDFRLFCNNKEKIYFKNFKKLNLLIEKIKSLDSNPFRFSPSLGLDNNLLTALNGLLEDNGIDPNRIRMGFVFRQEIIDQMREFKLYIEKRFSSIEKCEICSEIVELFKNNQRELVKRENLPEGDDYKILAGYINFKSKGNKFLISEDEHFWGYKDLILQHYKINVIEGWMCHKLLQD